MLVGFPLVRVLVGSARASGTRAGNGFISSSLFADSGHVSTTRRFWFLNVVFHIRGSSEPTLLAPGFNTIPRIGSQRKCRIHHAKNGTKDKEKLLTASGKSLQFMLFPPVPFDGSIPEYSNYG